MWLVFFSGEDSQGVKARRGCVNMNPDFFQVENEVRDYAINFLHLTYVHIERPTPLDIYAVGNIACSWWTRP